MDEDTIEILTYVAYAEFLKSAADSVMKQIDILNDWDAPRELIEDMGETGKLVSREMTNFVSNERVQIVFGVNREN